MSDSEVSGAGAPTAPNRKARCKATAELRAGKLTQPLTLTVKQSAVQLGISAERAYAAVAAGQIPVIVLGKRKVVPVAALERLLRGEAIEITEAA
jgi:hypothetical protein